MIRRIVTSAFLVIMAMVLFRTGLAHGQYIDAGWDGSTYTSPAYGYSVSWDEQEWEVGDSVGTAGFELRTRFASTGSLHIRAFRPKSGTPEECIDLWANSRFRTEGVSGFQQFESDGKPIGAQDASSAYGLFEYEYDGEDRCTDECQDELGWVHYPQTAAYIECRVLVPGDVVLEFLYVTSRKDFNQQLPRAMDVLSTLTLGEPDPAMLTPTPTPELVDPHVTKTPLAESVVRPDLIDPRDAQDDAACSDSGCG